MDWGKFLFGERFDELCNSKEENWSYYDKRFGDDGLHRLDFEREFFLNALTGEQK